MINSKDIVGLACVENIKGIVEEKMINVSTDSRTYSTGELFVALEGPTFNGVDFADAVIKRGCSLFVCRNSQDNVDKLQKYIDAGRITAILVTDTVTFLHQLAMVHIEKWRRGGDGSRKVVGITGSNGKTTYKEMLYHFINGLMPGRVLATYKNFNNHIGLPRTIFGLDDNYDFAILEMGTNHFGEIDVLCRIARPDVGIITNIGDAHLESFKDRDGVLKEKGDLYRSVKNDRGVFLQNMDDPQLAQLAFFDGTLSFGQRKGDYQVTFLDNSVEVKGKGASYLLKNDNIIGLHNYSNLAACFILSLHLFSQESEKLVMAATTFTPKDGRSMWIEKGRNHIFYDAYNANPSSMKSSIDGFLNYCRKHSVLMDDCLLVLGDMNELGDHTKKSHEELGDFLNKSGVKNAIFVGRFAHYTKSSFIGNGKVFASTAEFKNDHWNDDLEKYNYIFLKGSRSLQLEILVE